MCAVGASEMCPSSRVSPMCLHSPSQPQNRMVTTGPTVMRCSIRCWCFSSPTLATTMPPLTRAGTPTLHKNACAYACRRRRCLTLAGKPSRTPASARRVATVLTASTPCTGKYIARHCALPRNDRPRARRMCQPALKRPHETTRPDACGARASHATMHTTDLPRAALVPC